MWAIQTTDEEIILKLTSAFLLGHLIGAVTGSDYDGCYSE